MTRIVLLWIRLCCAIAITTHAYAVTTWTDWTSSTLGANGGGAATGIALGVGVTYTGELDSGTVINGTSSIWLPDATFIGGSSTVSPDVVGDYLRLNGSYTGTSTITFALPVVDPLIAIWSLGAPGSLASFTFSASPVLQAGGPNSSFGGSSVVVSGNMVSGQEGNGVVQFSGTYSAISFTNTPENWYAITVGVNDIASPIPEPASIVLSVAGLAGLIVALRIRRT